MEKKAILVGASGSIGSNLLSALLANTNYSEVLVIARKKIDFLHPKLQQLVIDFDQLNDYAQEIKGDVVFCCLGTTKKQTPDQKQYRKIDYQYPLDLAWITSKNGAESYHLVSSLGANKDSSIFYTRTKGELENDLKAVPFKSIHIYRPAALEREGKDNRFAEKIIVAVMRVVNPLLTGSLRKYRSIKVNTVAKAMVNQSLKNEKDILIYESDKIQDLSN